jgi:hypothetical protein
MRRSFQARKFHFTYSSSPSLRCSSCRASGIGQSPVHRSKSITSNFLTLAARYISTVSFVWPRRHPQFTLIHLRLFEGVTIPIPLQQQFWRKFGARTARLPYSAAMCHLRFVWARFQTNYSDYGLLPLPDHHFHCTIPPIHLPPSVLLRDPVFHWQDADRPSFSIEKDSHSLI